jgi:hypothetical protein
MLSGIKYSVLIGLLLALSCLFSCKKEVENKFDFAVDGVADISARVGDTKGLSINVSKLEGTPENVHLFLLNVPRGVAVSFENTNGSPDFSTTLSIIINNDIKLGKYPLTLVAQSAYSQKKLDFTLTVSDTVIMAMKVYDATQISAYTPAGWLCDSAEITLYKDETSFYQHIPFYRTSTDSTGVANIYNIPSGPYLFTVNKGSLNNIVSKVLIDNTLKGYATANVDSYGQLLFRDQNGDGKIDDLDRVEYDKLIIYDNSHPNRTVWISR